MMAFSSAGPVFLAVVFFATAVLYSAVGNAGASGYLAVLTFAGLAPEAMKSTALLLNPTFRTTPRKFESCGERWRIAS
jgi:hypothetical protein